MPEPEDQNLKNLIRSKGPKGPKLDHDPNDAIVAPSTIGLSTRQPRPVKAVDPPSVVLIRHRLSGRTPPETRHDALERMMHSPARRYPLSKVSQDAQRSPPDGSYKMGGPTMPQDPSGGRSHCS